MPVCDLLSTPVDVVIQFPFSSTMLDKVMMISRYNGQFCPFHYFFKSRKSWKPAQDVQIEGVGDASGQSWVETGTLIIGM
jgi:hypothetical protein